ncbi:MAG: N-acetyltransferase [Gloeomargaritaceae cyanobacterium C42_A2020_066]|nr:N-acetyltransferase [Gloeomargaritaceae cyanobacterium C42_A2020_066]
MSDLTLRWLHSLADIPTAAWNALALPLHTPFLEWEWLYALEQSGSATARTGWLPCHLTLWRGDSLVAAAPLYLKSHSYGEFVFDHQWAELGHRLGEAYYPKLVGMTPFTPAVGYRFLVASGESEILVNHLFSEAIDQFCQQQGISSCHLLFTDPHWQLGMQPLDWHCWLHHHFLWHNPGFHTFEDYLTGFNANQRRNIKRERQAVQQAGLGLRTIQGPTAPEHFYTLVHDFYSNTCDKFLWGSKYLTPQFFRALRPAFAHRLLFVAASEPGREAEPTGMAFCVTKGDRLYGRYWGSWQDIHALHFETCYYTPIEWAIQQGITTFDPGAGGRHKRRRGFVAVPNHSLHRFYHRRLGSILPEYIRQVNPYTTEEINAINQDVPLKSLPDITVAPGIHLQASADAGAEGGESDARP